MVERINWDNTGAVIKACEVLKKGGVRVVNPKNAEPLGKRRAARQTK